MLATDHRDTMLELAKAQGWRQGIELGLGSGQLFGRLLGQGIRMIGVDLGRRPDRRGQIERIMADPALQPHIERVYWMPTRDAAHGVPNGWADFVFIDAAHSFHAVQADIAAWLPKVREGGWFGGHDYHPKFPGVIRAVDQAFGPGVVQLPGFIWARP